MNSFKLGFVCPKCGSEFFRTIKTEGNNMTRQCKGHWVNSFVRYSGCDYTWESKHDNAHGLENHHTPQEPME